MRPVLAACLLALAVALALLASDVRAWERALAGGDAVYAASPARASWTPPARLGSLAPRLLGVDDDVRLRRALQQYASVAGERVRLDNALDVQTARARAESALDGAARDGDPLHAAQARTLLGVLAFRTAAAGGDETQVDAAASDFEDAIRAAPSYEPAKYDLELVLRLGAAHGSRRGPGSGSGVGSTGRRGAGGGTPGRGY